MVVAFNYIKYFVKEGFKNIWNNRTMSLASILVMSCCLILTGGAILLSENIARSLKTVGSNNSITVYLNDNISYENSHEIEHKINSLDNIKFCEFYSKEEAIQEYKEMLGDLYDSFRGEENPFPDAFHVSMKDLSLYNETIKTIQDIDGVESVSDRGDTAKRLTDLNNLVSVSGFWIIVSLGTVSLFIISNTIRITMYNRRFEISIMKSIGATNWFVRIPFLIEGILIGTASGVVSLFSLKFLYIKILEIINNIVPINGVVFGDVFYRMLISFLVSGVSFGLLGGLISISRYLKREGVSNVAW
ncbi:MAG: FtsX-like permease family protein [Candidatus Paraimprobicoccus trichonymphae]|uniref:Cell division protein FtsX n=1 Tax=Candidatus Paraimprobicoccus trichonymphae TaxID=3033793 RepID=A0AA48I4L7_9FIRM|nr:MAG: FtsX-like permease family protein [Candidatus Paraimprobicoccus trichonymphae]